MNVLDRIDRAAGKPPVMIPVVDPNPSNRSAMATKDSNAAMGDAENRFKNFRNEVTLQRQVISGAEIAKLLHEYSLY